MVFAPVLGLRRRWILRRHWTLRRCWALKGRWVLKRHWIDFFVIGRDREIRVCQVCLLDRIDRSRDPLPQDLHYSPDWHAGIFFRRNGQASESFHSRPALDIEQGFHDFAVVREVFGNSDGRLYSINRSGVFFGFIAVDGLRLSGGFEFGLSCLSPLAGEQVPQ